MILFLTAIIMIGIISCIEGNCLKNNITRIDIENNINNFKPFSLSDLECYIEYVVLETKNAPILGSIKTIDISSEYIVVSDLNQCVLFCRNGNFISTIGNKGRGPGEYHGLGQIRIFDDKIFLPDYSKNEFILYNTEGEFIKTFKSRGRFSVKSGSWIPLTDTTYLVSIPNQTGKEKYRIALINDKGEILKKYPNSTFFVRGGAGSFTGYSDTQFYRLNTTLFYKENFNDTIWRIDDEQLSPVYILDRGKYGVSIEYWGLFDKISIEKISNQINIINVFESEKYIYSVLGYMKHYPFTFFRESNTDIFMGIVPPGPSPHDIIGLYNKLTEEFFVVAPSNVDDQIEPTGIKNDIDGGINFMPRYAVNDSLILSWFEPYQLKMYVASETFKKSVPKFPEKKKKLKELAASLDENDNPVLMLLKLKE